MTTGKRLSKMPEKASLVETLERDVKQTTKPNIVFMAGHFPLSANERERNLRPNFVGWGNFTLHSLDLACKLASFTESIGKTAQFALISDDHSRYLPKSSWISRKRNSFYKSFSGPNAELSPVLKDILQAEGFDESNVMRFDHGKPGRESCLYGSENVLIANRMRNMGSEEFDCAKAYAEFIDSHIDKSTTYLVSFIPHKCEGKVCAGVLDRTEGLEASHVFVHTDIDSPSDRKLTIPELYSKAGVWYRKD